MSYWILAGVIMIIGIFALVYIIMHGVTDAMVTQIRPGLTNTTNVNFLDTYRTIDYFWPGLVLLLILFWAFNQAQKSKQYGG